MRARSARAAAALLALLLRAARGLSAVSAPPRAAVDRPLIARLSRERFGVVRGLADAALIDRCSRLAAAQFEAHGGHDGTYLARPWKNSRIWVDAGRTWTSDGDAAYFEPLLAAARRDFAGRFNLVPPGRLDDADLLARALPLESAFVNYYVGHGDQPRDMRRHVDCDWRGAPVPLSCVVQGSYANSDAARGDVLGVLDCQRDARAPAEAVSLAAGDCLVLAKAYHKPHPVPEGAKRLVFVMFFSALVVQEGATGSN